jgi:hypothetical protein
MKKIEKAGMIDEWAKNTLDFAAERWGKENIIRATVHLDEAAPHMHLHFVPLTKDGRLAAKDIITQKSLKSLQDDYAQRMKSYGLERGMDGSKAQHITTRQHYAQQNEIEGEIKALIDNPREPNIIKRIVDALRTLVSENKRLKAEKEPQQKLNPDKPNIYEKPRTTTERTTTEQSRNSVETKRPNRGFSI